MTNQEAIEELKYDCNELGKAIPCDTGWGVAINSAYDMAIKALEKQIPKKINNKSVIKTFPMSVHGNCPICGSKNLLLADTDYCNACGQKLDWSDES